MVILIVSVGFILFAGAHGVMLWMLSREQKGKQAYV
jgi:flagellar basal body-associated protein FliL